MAECPSEMREHMGKGLEQMAAAKPEQMEKFSKFIQSVFKDGTLDCKTKELIAVAISVYNRCQYCIAGHAKNALDAGASKEEILEAATVAMAFGGGPAMAYSSTLLMDALNECEK